MKRSESCVHFGDVAPEKACSKKQKWPLSFKEEEGKMKTSPGKRTGCVST